MVGQQCHGLDRLRPRQQARRPRPVVRPDGARRRCQDGDALDRPLRHVARARRRPVDRLRAKAVGEEVDQIGDVRRGLLDEGTDRLSANQRLGDGRGQPHHFDAEARVDGLDPIAEQPGQPPGIAHRPRRADPYHLRAIVDALAEEVQVPGAEPSRLERGAELGRQLADVPRDGLGRSDRLGEGAARLDEVGWTHRLDRLGDVAERLVEASDEFEAEAPRERCARLRQQVADPFEAEDAQIEAIPSGSRSAWSGRQASTEAPCPCGATKVGRAV